MSENELRDGRKKNSKNIGIWNIRALNRKNQQVEKELEHQIDMCAL